MDHGHHHHHHQQHPQQLHRQYSSAGSIDTAGTNTSGGDRFPQWSAQETRDFLMIRADLDPTFMETKRNKLLWEIISTRMKEKGYNRSAEQCKCKWKNLVTRYKGCETMESDGLRQQFPFYIEMQTIFAARMERMLWLEAEGGGGGGGATTSASKKKAAASAQFSSSDDDENEESESELRGVAKKKRKTIKGGTSTNPSNQVTTSGNPGNNHTILSAMKDMLEKHTKQQMEIEVRWFKAYEEREEERRVKEMEWRQTMEALENERIMMDRRWREREEQRRMRDEARAEKRDALITALLNKLRREDHV